MQRDAKFGYGFLFVGAAMPYLADKIFGPIPALVVAAIILIVGIIFLVSAHSHGAPHARRTLAMTIWLFTLYGAGIGALGGGIAGAIRKLAIKPSADELLISQVAWVSPAPIVEGTPLSTVQLNAVSPIEGVFTYDPPAGTVLPVGTHSLTATFYARDSAKYMLHTETRSIRIIPAPSSLPHTTIPLKPAHFELRAPGFKQLPNSPPFRLMIPMINTGDRSAFDLEYRILIIGQTNNIVSADLSGSVGGEIPPNSPTPYWNDSVFLPVNQPPQYIILRLRYKETEGSKTIKTQVIYMQWSGVENGKTSPDFTYVSIEQEKEVKNIAESLMKDK
jgi:hypothetical protein